MRKKILLMLSAFCFLGATVFGQAIEGGAGVIHVNGNPNFMLTMDDLTVNEGQVAYDRTTNTAYFFDVGGTNFATNTPAAGTQWIALNVSSLVDPITSVVVTDDGVGPPELTATTVGGVVTLEFQSNAAITFNNTSNVLTFTDVDGDVSTLDFTTVTDLVDIQPADPSITVSGNGSSASPYLLSLTGALGATAGTVPVTDGTTGALTWTRAVTGATINTTTGELELVMTGGANVNVDLSTIPEVSNMGQVTTRITALASGESALLKASALNTFGMPATSGFGVIFVIEKP